MRCGWLIVLGLLSASARAAAQDEQPAEVEEEVLPPPGAPPRVAFQQLLAAPRIGDRLVSMAIDRTDPDSIYIGTEEGTVIRTHDGGITWQESQLSPFNVLARSVGGPVSILPTPALDFAREGDLGADPVMDRRTRASLDVDLFNLPLDLPVPPTSSIGMINAAIASRAQERLPIQRMEACPGGRYPLLVATVAELYGSADGGRTFVRIFNGSSASPFVARVEPQINSVACSPTNPNDIAVATARGVYRSTDGGLTFTNQVRGVTAGTATAVGWDIPTDDPNHNPALLVAMDTLLFVGDPDSEGGLSFVYPDFNNPGLAPFFTIQSIDVSPSAQIWLGTTFGPRASLDGGLTWQRAGGIILAAEPITQIAVGAGHGGRERVAFVTDQFVYTSEDNGDTLYPFFVGISRRSIRRANPGGIDENGEPIWYVLTTGELWRTGGSEPVPTFDARPIRRWARSRIAVTPPLDQVLRTVFDELDITAVDIDDIFIGASNREFVPVIGVEATWVRSEPRRHRMDSLTRVFESDMRGERRGFSVFLSATWSLPDYWWPQRIEWPKAELYELQQQIGFLVEDAWHERRMHLTRLSNEGYVDELQAETLRARVEALEALLETWIGGPLEEVREGEW